MTLPATIYARFSNQEQSLGSSKSRQLKLCREMISDQKWELSADRILIDEGLSAFSGANRAPGGLLYEFEKQTAAGLFKNGHVLVVEHIDRISRQGHDEVLPFVKKMTDAGVTVAVASGKRIYKAYERVTLGAVIEAVVAAELAREESDNKSKRLKAAQNERIIAAQKSAAEGQHISKTRTVPAWINVERISRLSEPPLYRMTLNEDRVAVLREIFQLTIDGYGTPAIAKKLNERGEPVWNHLERKSNNGWTVGYLTKIVLNRAVMGEYHPMNRPRSGKETSKNIAVLNHFPQAIDPVMFAKAHAGRQARKGTSGAWQITHNNVFSGIAKCGHCGGRMKQEVTVRKGTLRSHKSGRYPARQTFSYLKCHNALNKVWDESAGKLRCANRNWIRYEAVEKSVLDVAMKFVVARQDVASDSRSDALRIEIADRQRFIGDKQKQVENLVDSYSRTGSPAIERMLLQLESELIGDQAAVRELEMGLAGQSEDVSLEELEARLEGLLASIDSENEEERSAARVRVKQNLRRIITRMDCFDDKLTVVELDRAVRVIFDNDGNEVFNAYINETIHGPNGEIDWHPDFPDAEYEYAEVD
ncbi:recombinase family protein [Sphingobium sp. Z007]|uniref:recombinase family protein n=1 Tax=Sphingobium sp. Z007 TaxID=627495 RepID=UPI000B4A4320|nr:recombinase family protein [Sphingobium sp. Z007]